LREIFIRELHDCLLQAGMDISVLCTSFSFVLWISTNIARRCRS
jgi:hypothetical protein